MWSSRLYTSLFLLLVLLFLITPATRAFDDEADEYEVNARVVRISLISGEVSLKRIGNTDWERARLNYPLVEGDTVQTDRESRVEIQFDARNFVRLAPSTTMQIVALREEGVALGVAEGIATVRLVKFDRQREYFEIDAPRSTMAAEKTGFYRVDVPNDNRVRFTVRDGGSARIYSDTSGFALRDGRIAELVVTGDNAGDWEFIATAFDAMDDWVLDREKYLAQRLRYNVQYYDEYVWGAEDLDAYGDWSYTTDYGWLWSPHGTNAYVDWAPYRYGHWVWCPPYGWTWVGYEPWGWAPYHYGRWVYHKGIWAWCPRSAYFREHSSWRPSLVAFFNVNDTFYWYPLGYHQHDPHSRNYNHRDRHDEIARTQRGNPVWWRCVTEANGRQFGRDNERHRRAEEGLARRALGTSPLRDLPGRPPRSDSAGRNESGGSRPFRGTTWPIGSTGASTRTPGVPLDDELRRSRIFNGREPRSSAPAGDSATGARGERAPTGVLTRPGRQPREGADRDGTTRPPFAEDPRRDRRAPAGSNDNDPRPTRVDPAPSSESSEKPMRGRVRVDPTRTERRSEPRAQTTEAPQSGPPARVDAPASETPPQRFEPPPQPTESPRTERPQRTEWPRNERPQRTESPRNEPPQRSESPRSEPRSEPPSRPSRPDNYEPPPSSESPRSEPPRTEPTRSGPSRSESPRSESPRSESPRSEPSRSESPRSESPRSEPSRSESPRSEPRSEPARDPDTGRPSRPDKPRR